MARKKRKTITISILFGLALIAVAAAAYIKFHNPPAKPVVERGLPKATPSTPTDTPRNNTALPQSSSPSSSPSGAITITQPTQGGTVQDGSTVSGHLTGSSGQLLYYRLKGGASGQVASGQIQTSGSTYSFPLAFSTDIKGGPDQGTLEVYHLGTNGAETDAASVNVTIQ